MIPFPEKKYSILYADPPWQYFDKALAGNRGSCCKYSVQPKSWIASLPVGSIAEKDCALFLWVTHPQLEVGFEILKSWGFKYKTVAFCWVKQNRKSESLFWGMGSMTRANSEICLLATRGKPKRINAGVHSVLISPVRRHSEKPDEVRTRIVELLGDLPRIELFARKQTPGWDVWGDEV